MKVKNPRAKSRTVTFHLRIYDRGTNKVLDRFIKGISVNLSEHAENPMLFITDEFNQDAFCIPYINVVEVTQLGSETKPRKPRTLKAKSTISLLKARA